MKFTAVIRTAEGTQEHRTIEAKNRFEVYAQAEKDGETIISMSEGSKGSSASWMNIRIGGEKIKNETRITFAKNLASMLTAGLTLSRALSVIERQSSDKTLKSVVADLQDKIKAGTSFHEALENHKNIFSKLFIAMTKAGEEGGTLSDTLKVVARQMDRSENLSKKIKGAMIYPAIIIVAMVVIFILMLLFVVPTLAATFAQLGGGLPLPTQIIIDISDFMVHNFIIVGIGIVVVVVGGGMFFRTKFGHYLILATSVRLPVIGDLVKETYCARAARTLASLLTSGVEMLTALSITHEVVGDNFFGTVVAEAETRVRKGEALSAAFIDNPNLFPVFFGDMISVGEETGKVSDMLTQVAEYYETDVEDRTKDLSTIIEPVLMLVIGLGVGVFAVSMIAPIYSLSSKL